MIKSNMRPFSLLFLACFQAALGYAQTPEENESKMDEIKMDEKYIYGEGFNDEKEIAYQTALTDLTTTVNELRLNDGKTSLSSSDLLTVVKELQSLRDKRHTVLVYLPLSQALALTSTSRSDILSQTPSSPPSQSNSSSHQQNKPTQNFTFVSHTQSETTSPSLAETPLPDDIVQTLCGQDNWVEIKGFLTSYRGQGKIASIGNVTSYAEVPDGAYAILMDSMGGILSILSPKNKGTLIDYRTNQTDDVSNHSNCKFIVWYK